MVSNPVNLINARNAIISLRILGLEPVWNVCKHPRHHLRGLPRTCVHCEKVFWCSNRCDKANRPVHEPNCASKRGRSVKANAGFPPHSSENSDHGAASQATTDEAVKGERDGGGENDEKDEELTDSALQSPTLTSSPSSSDEEGSTDSAFSLPSLTFSTDDEDEGGSMDNGILILTPTSSTDDVGEQDGGSTDSGTIVLTPSCSNADEDDEDEEDEHDEAFDGDGSRGSVLEQLSAELLKYQQNVLGLPLYFVIETRRKR
jgi:hypothetical protein